MKKGQAAIEYLITYGWAFLVILVMISAFAYFGLLNPSRYLPARCDFGSQLKCHDYKLLSATNSNGYLLLKFDNEFTQPIRIFNITTSDDQGMFKKNDINSEPIVNDFVVIGKDDVSDTLILDLRGTPYVLVEGDKVLIPVKITFSRDSDNAPKHVILGEVFAKVQST